MDPFSATASAIAVVQIVGEVFTLLQDYALAVKDARKDIQCLSAEILLLHDVFEKVEDLKNQPGSARLKTVELLAQPGGPIQQCQDELKDLLAKLNQGHGPTTMRRVGWRALKWPFTSKDVNKKIEFFERHKTTISLALSSDNTTTLLGIGLEMSHIDDGVTRIDRGLTRLREDFKASQSNATALRVSKKHDLIVGWLATTDPSSNHNAACKKCQLGTGTWFAQGPAMGLWKEQNSMLWLYGIPGCGKTILSSTIIETAIRDFRADPATIVAYYYFSFNDNEKQTAFNMASSLLAQICRSTIDLPEDLTTLYDRCDNGKRKPLISELKAMLKLIAARTEEKSTADVRNVFVVIDALDECPQRDSERQEVLDLISEMKSWSSNLHLLVTSRKEADIEEKLQKLVTEPPISIQGSQVAADIELYINNQLETAGKLKRLPQDLKLEIKKTILKGANGMFRWVFCQLEALEKCPPLRNSILKALKNLPPTLNATYERILTNIEDDDSQRIARNCLLWLAFSRRSLTLQELAEAAVLTEEFSNVERLLEPDYIVELLGSLIFFSGRIEHTHKQAEFVIENVEKRLERGTSTESFPGNTVVKLAHFSVVDYLVSREIRTSKAAFFAVQNTAAHVFISGICLQYIFYFNQSASDDTKARCRKNNMSFEWRSTLVEHRYHLLDYACKAWDYHLKKLPATNQNSLEAMILKLFHSGPVLSSWLNIREPSYLSHFDSGRRTNRRHVPSVPLFHASGLGLKQLVLQLLEAKMDVNKKCYGKTALQAAITSQHESIVQLLLDSGAKINVVDDSARTPLHQAVLCRNYNLVRILLEGGANVGAVDHLNETPLHYAIVAGNKSIVELLLKSNADVNHRDYSNTTPLHVAAFAKDTRIGQLLVDFSADVSAQDKAGYTALHKAVMCHNNRLCKFLIDSGTDINKQDNEGCAALHEAARKQYLSIVKMLLEAGADITLKDEKGDTALGLVTGPRGRDRGSNMEAIVKVLQAAVESLNKCVS